MRRGERGFTLIELLVVIAIVALIAGAATMSIFQVINVTRSTNDHMTAIRQAQNAGYWISRDALMAEHMIVGADPETTFFLKLTWTEWGFDDDSIYHSVTYSLQDLPGGLKKLMRTHSSGGVEKQTLVAEYIYYNSDDPDDPENTMVEYTNLVLTARITALFGEATETKEYTVWPRPNF